MTKMFEMTGMIENDRKGPKSGIIVVIESQLF